MPRLIPALEKERKNTSAETVVTQKLNGIRSQEKGAQKREATIAEVVLSAVVADHLVGVLLVVVPLAGVVHVAAEPAAVGK